MPEEIKTASSEDFITKSPLFVRIAVDGFEPPPRITFDCETEGCGKGTTWFRVYCPFALGKQDSRRAPEVVDWALQNVAYKCAKCGKSALSVVYREMRHEKRPLNHRGRAPVPPIDINHPPPPPTLVNLVVEVMKVGQYPEPAIELPDALEKNLGKDSAILYRKSLICRNIGYGLAAAGYIRRVVEDKTNELIEVVAKYAEVEGVDAAKVAEIRAAADSASGYTPFDEKLKIAAAVFPDSLKVGGKNPLLGLYGLVSEGIHGKSEKECIEIAESTNYVFQYVFSKLKAETEAKKEYIEKMKKLP